MNRDLTLANPDGWPIEAYDSAESLQGRRLAPTLDLPTLLKIVWEWRWLILATVAAGVALAAVYAMTTTPLYRASVILQVNPPTVEIMDENNNPQAEVQSPDAVATQVGLLSSHSLAERVAQDLNLGSNPEIVRQDADPKQRLQDATDAVESGLTVIPPDEGEVIKFTYDSSSPTLSAQIANAIADAFLNSSIQRRYESSAYARNFLQKQIAKTRAELEKSERQLVSYAQAQGIISTATDTSSSPLTTDANSPTGQALSNINNALSEATARRIAAEGAYRAALNGGITTIETASSQALRQSLAALQTQYQQKRVLMKPDHPDLLSLNAQIKELKTQIARENSGVEQSRINALRSDYEAAAAAERALQAKVGQLKSDVLNLRGRSIQYAILQRDVDTNRALYDALLQRYKQIGVAGGIGTAPVSIVDRAVPPSSPFKPRVLLALLAGLALGFFGGVAAAVALEYLNDTIKTREDVRMKLGLACLGIVPKLPAKNNFVAGLEDPSSGISEAYSTVAASLRFTTESGVPRVLLLTSSRPGEGKSSSALALAQNFSRRARSVLLIDCDLRKPAFKSPSDNKGLTKLLTNTDRVADHVMNTYFENLSLLPSGPIPPNPADLLSTGRFQSIVREAASQFDIVIIDTPPVLSLADVPLIASVCKNVMFVIESGKTRTSVARECLGKLEAAGAHVLGATLTKSSGGRGAYGYDYGYGYGEAYGYGHKIGAGDDQRTEIALVRDESNT